MDRHKDVFAMIENCIIIQVRIYTNKYIIQARTEPLKIGFCPQYLITYFISYTKLEGILLSIFTDVKICVFCPV